MIALRIFTGFFFFLIVISFYNCGNGGGESKSEETNFPPQISSFFASPNLGNAPLNVRFNWHVSDKDNSYLICYLDVDNDGISDYTVNNCIINTNITHIYSKPGRYYPKLTVSDGKQSTYRSTVIFVQNTPPTIENFSVNNDNPNINTQVEFSFRVSDPNNDELTCLFDLDEDGTVDKTITPCTEGTVSFSYSNIGEYKAKLIVKDPYDDIEEKEITLNVKNESSGTLSLTNGGQVEVLDTETEQPDNSIVIKELNAEEELGFDEKIHYITNVISIKSNSISVTSTENNDNNKFIKIKISLNRSLSEEDIKKMKVYYVSPDELIPLAYKYDENTNILEVTIYKKNISDELKFVVVSNFYSCSSMEEISPDTNSGSIYIVGCMYPELPVPLKVNNESLDLGKIYVYDPENKKYIVVKDPEGNEETIKIKGNVDVGDTDIPVDGWKYFAFRTNKKGFYIIKLYIEKGRFFKRNIKVTSRKIPVDRNFSIEPYKDLLIRYAPVLEFGDLEYIKNNINQSLYNELKNDWYGCYTKEKYRPIALEDVDVYRDGFTNLLGNVCFSDISPVEARFYVLSKDDKGDKKFNTKLKYLYRFSGLPPEENLIRTGVSDGFEYAILGENGQHAAKLLTIDRSNLITKLYATALADDNYIYLQYWFYYPYDPKAPADVGKIISQHEGDAERITVVLNKNTQKPVYVFFAHHNDNQKFAFRDISGNLAFKWNEKGFGDKENGIGGAIVDWEKVEKEGTHPVAYVALGSHGIYPRKGIYVVDQPYIENPIKGVDLVEFAGGGERVNYGSEDKISFVPRLTDIDENHPLSFLYYSGGTYNEDLKNAIQSVTFFSMSEAFLFPEKKDGCKKENNEYCQDIDITDELFPNIDIISDEIECVSIASDQAKVTFYFLPRITADLDFMPRDGYKIIIDWGDVQQEVKNLTNITILAYENGEVLSYTHTYRASGVFTPKVSFITPTGIKIEKVCSQSITVTGPRATGNLKGSVLDAITREPLSNVHVTLISDDDSAYTLDEYTDINGNYSFNEVPVGEYTIRFEKEGYITAIGHVTIEEDQTYTYQTLLYIDEQHAGNGILSGVIKDALTGSTVGNAYIKVCSGFLNLICALPVQEVYSDENGNFSVELEAGYYTVIISKDGYNDGFYNISIIGGIENYQEFTISPILPQGEIRIVLTWGETPPDLDSHLVKIKNEQVEYHVYYADKRPTEEADLDVDDVTSFGPETITIHNMDTSAVYKYYVHDFSTYSGSDSMVLANSGATVKVYYGDNVYTFHVPNEPGVAWKVFEIKNGQIFPCSESCVFDVGGSTDSKIGIKSLNIENHIFDNILKK